MDTQVALKLKGKVSEEQTVLLTNSYSLQEKLPKPKIYLKSLDRYNPSLNSKIKGVSCYISPREIQYTFRIGSLIMESSFEIKMTFKITHVYHVMINYHKTDGVTHLLAGEEEQCHEDLSKNYTK